MIEREQPKPSSIEIGKGSETEIPTGPAKSAREEITDTEITHQKRLAEVRKQAEAMRVRDETKIEEIRRELGLRQEMLENAPVTRDPKGLLLTPEEEGRVQKGEFYRFEAKSSEQEICVLGVRHTNKLEEAAPMHSELEQYDPEIVIVEGRSLEEVFSGESFDEIMEKDSAEVLRQKGEQVYMAWLAKKRGKEVAYWDLPAAEEVRGVLGLKDEKGLTIHSPDTVVGWISTYGLHKIYEMGMSPSYESLKQVISIAMPGVEKYGIDLSQSKIDEVLKRYTGRTLAEFAESFADERLRAEYWELARRVSDPVPKDEKGEPLPLEQVGETNRVLRDMNRIRDEHAVEVFQRVKQMGAKRVLVTAGGSHAVTWERAIKEIYKEN